MRCPKCTSIEDKVIDSRISKEGSTIRRRRECLECGHRYSTTEMLVRDGVVDALEAQFEKEIPSRAIGEGVMQRLRTVDQVAYVRFASIYKQFRDVAEFVDEISTLGKPKKENR